MSEIPAEAIWALGQFSLAYGVGTFFGWLGAERGWSLPFSMGLMVVVLWILIDICKHVFGYYR